MSSCATSGVGRTELVRHSCPLRCRAAMCCAPSPNGLHCNEHVFVHVVGGWKRRCKRVREQRKEHWGRQQTKKKEGRRNEEQGHAQSRTEHRPKPTQALHPPPLPFLPSPFSLPALRFSAAGTRSSRPAAWGAFLPHDRRGDVARLPPVPAHPLAHRPSAVCLPCGVCAAALLRSALLCLCLCSVEISNGFF
jgi:hypothetical protein